LDNQITALSCALDSLLIGTLLYRLADLLERSLLILSLDTQFSFLWQESVASTLRCQGYTFILETSAIKQFRL